MFETVYAVNSETKNHSNSKYGFEIHIHRIGRYKKQKTVANS